MAKKIYDIKPPKSAHKAETKIKPKAPHLAVARHEKKEKHFAWPWVFVVILVVVLGVGTYLFFTLPEADIQIWPKVDTLSFQQTLTADKSAQAIDSTKKVIPAQYFTTAKTESQDFPATGSASNNGKAVGTITIFNKYDPPAPFTFKAGTHFMSDSGKLFVALQKIAIPAAKKFGSKITAGQVQAQVQAVEAGDSYNIAPSNFSVPGLKGTAYYYSINATSATAMAGGYTGNVKKVTDDDLQGAKDVLTKKATDDAMADLKSQIPSDYILLDNAISSITTSAQSQTKSGAIADKFTYQVAVQASALAFKKSDIEQFAKNYIISQLPQGNTLLDNTFKTDYSASTVDVSLGKATVNLNFSSGAYKNIDKNSLSLSFLGESANQIKTTINNALGDKVSKVQINFWPFWVTSVPNNQSRVSVELKF